MDEADRQRLALAGKLAEDLAGAGAAILHPQQRGKARIGVDGVDIEAGEGEIGAARIQHVARQLVGAGVVVELVRPLGVGDHPALRRKRREAGGDRLDRCGDLLGRCLQLLGLFLAFLLASDDLLRGLVDLFGGLLHLVDRFLRLGHGLLDRIDLGRDDAHRLLQLGDGRHQSGKQPVFGVARLLQRKDAAGNRRRGCGEDQSRQGLGRQHEAEGDGDWRR